jgi:formate dehydrogenase major subunit
MELSRRDFLKVSAAGAAAAAALDFAPAPAMAAIAVHGGDHADQLKTFHTTCPYCSASCGQVVVVGDVTGDVYDLYGDVDSPINNGGLCAKGAGAYQLVTNKRRLGAFNGTTAHPVNPLFAYDSTYDAATYESGSNHQGVAYKRTGNGPWSKVALPAAFDDIATQLVALRGNIVLDSLDEIGVFNAKAVQFFGCSHMNNEQNYLYRRLIAEFGTSRTEHQARI